MVTRMWRGWTRSEDAGDSALEEDRERKQVEDQVNDAF